MTVCVRPHRNSYRWRSLNVSLSGSPTIEFFKVRRSVQWAGEKVLNLSMSWLHQRALASRMRYCMLTGPMSAPPNRPLDPIRALPANLII